MKKECILDIDGNIIHRSQNLAGIHRYVSNHLIKVVAICEIGSGNEYHEGKLMILFNDGSSFETNFASFIVLKQCIRSWRNIYGSPLRVNDKICGEVSYNNPALQ